MCVLALSLEPHHLPFNRVNLVLGQPTDPTGEYFQGEISQANVFTAALDQSQISAMGSNCSVDQLVGDMYAWPLSEAYLIGEVSVVTPALCGRSQCPPGFYGSYCDLERGNEMMRLVVVGSEMMKLVVVGMMRLVVVGNEMMRLVIVGNEMRRLVVEGHEMMRLVVAGHEMMRLVAVDHEMMRLLLWVMK